MHIMEELHGNSSRQSAFFMSKIDNIANQITDTQKKIFFDRWRWSFEVLSRRISFEGLRHHAIPITKESMRDLQFLYSSSALVFQDDAPLQALTKESQQGENYIILIDMDGNFKIVDQEYIDHHYADLAYREDDRQKILSSNEKFMPYLPLWLELVTQPQQYFWEYLTHGGKQELRSILTGDELPSKLRNTMKTLLESHPKEKLLHDKFLCKATTLQTGDYVVAAQESNQDNTVYEVIEVDIDTIVLDDHQGNGRIVIKKDQVFLKVNKALIIGIMRNASL